MYDTIIVGAGPAGLSAAIYTARRKMKTLVISKDLGGQAVLTDKIYNYPGIKFTTGMDLMQTFKEQAAENGAEFLFTEVKGLTEKDGVFTVTTPADSFEAKTIILSFGLTPRDIGLEGEEKFIGDSIFFAPTEHTKQCKGKKVAIIGGGNSAFGAVMHLQPVAEKIYLIHRSEKFSGEEVTLEKIKGFKNVEMVLNSEAKEIVEDGKLKGLVVENKDSRRRILDVDAVCVCIGYTTNTKWLGELVDLSERGYIKISKDCETKTAGLYGAGDCTDITYKQVITSGGEGCKAALKAHEYLLAKDGKRALLIDWS